MKISKTQTTGLLMGLSFLTFVAFKARPDVPKKYEILFITTTHYDLDQVNVSIDGREFKKYNFEHQIKGGGDLNPMINLIHEYEEQGWELVSAELGNVRHGFRLQRLKN